MSILRRMQPEDVPMVHQIEKSVCVAPWTEKIFLDCLAVGYECWVLEKDSDIIGFGLFSEAVNEAHILNLAIHPKWQRQGLGRKMMCHLIQEAKNLSVSVVYLEVRVSNLPAISLYRSLSFTEIGIRKDYYRTQTGREDAAVFVLSIN